MRAPHLAKLAALFLPVAVCASNAPAQKMYWSSFSQTARANLDGTQFETIISGRGWATALDLLADKVYRARPFERTIERANLDGSEVEEILADVLANGLAIDAQRGKMYFSNFGTLTRANLDGTDLEELLPDASAYAIALDLTAEKVYWTTALHFRVMRANLNGTHVETLIPETSPQPVAIALDLQRRKMYWAATDMLFGKRGAIQRANLDGSDVEDVVDRVLSLGIAIDDIRGVLYFTDILNGIDRVDLDGSNRTQLISLGDDPLGIALDLRGLPIPAVSAWGLVIIGLSIVTIHVAARRRRACASQRTL